MTEDSQHAQAETDVTTTSSSTSDTEEKPLSTMIDLCSDPSASSSQMRINQVNSSISCTVSLKNASCFHRLCISRTYMYYQSFQRFLFYKFKVLSRQDEAGTCPGQSKSTISIWDRARMGKLDHARQQRITRLMAAYVVKNIRPFSTVQSANFR